MAVLGQVAVALELDRAIRGRWPDSLTELDPKLLTRVPTDPCDPAGGTLQYGAGRLRGDTLAVWSVGPDGEDQGGLPRDPFSGRGDLRYPLR